MIISTLTNDELVGILHTFQTWNNQCVESNAIPVIGIALKKEGDGRQIIVLQGALTQMATDTIKQLLRSIAENL